jgi:ArsR family transcriptional regulator
MGHPLRFRVLELLAQRERSVRELLDEVDVQQPYLSQQLGVLRRVGLVTGRREGSHVMYALTDRRVVQVLALTRDILVDRFAAAQEQLRG